MTFGDVPGDGQNTFETVLRLVGRDPKEWRQATLMPEIARAPHSGLSRKQGGRAHPHVFYV